MNTTRRHPRTLVEAFGPYASGPILEPERAARRSDRIVLRACYAVSAAVLILIIAGVIK